MNDEQLVEIGNEADVLLKNETFNKLLNLMVDGTVQSFLTSAEDETAEREKAYNHYRALTDMVATLRQMIEVRDQVHSKDEPITEEELTTEEE
tara:strand:+ start:5356 stop:5634 length:279 start_codon:yes stop_codon:yes gene_type:complete